MFFYKVPHCVNENNHFIEFSGTVSMICANAGLRIRAHCKISGTALKSLDPRQKFLRVRVKILRIRVMYIFVNILSF
jgi:hypothetical protein